MQKRSIYRVFSVILSFCIITATILNTNQITANPTGYCIHMSVLPDESAKVLALTTVHRHVRIFNPQALFIMFNP